jgi:23S rRNA (guanosine2251-2'-O)-methyltransferase
MKGQALQTIDFKRNVCLVMGSEGKGIGTLLEKTCDQLVAIPTKGHIDSLNVSVAAGISCYEIRRQQDFPFL